MEKGAKHTEETKQKIAESMKGTSNAEKWTEETVAPILEQIKEYAKTEECLWLGDALVYHDLYREIWSDWKKKFSTSKTISQTIKSIDQIFESKLFALALKNKVNPSVAIFGLKNNHKWKDSREITGDKDKPLSVEGFTFEVVTNDGNQ